VGVLKTVRITVKPYTFNRTPFSCRETLSAVLRQSQTLAKESAARRRAVG